MATLSLNPDFVYEEEIRFRTLITEMENGVEQRRAKYSAPLRAFRLVYNNRDSSDYGVLKAFYIARLGPFESFTWNNLLDSTNYTVRFEEDSMLVKETSYDFYDITFRLIEVR